MTAGQEQTQKQRTASEHVDIFLKLNSDLFMFCSFIGATFICMLFDFATINVL
jgi:hypothetical protein